MRTKLFLISLLLTVIGCSEENTYRVSSGTLSIELTKSGEIVGFTTDKVSRPIRGFIRLEGCSDEEGITVRKPGKGILEFSRIVKNQSGNQARITERFIPNPTGIRWEAEIAGLDAPWTTPIQRVWDYNTPDSVKENIRFWTAWSDPACSDSRPGAGKWTDPLVTPAVSQLNEPVLLYYGLKPFSFDAWSINTPEMSNMFCIPMLSFLEPDNDFGITLAQALSDTLLDITLSLTKTGEAALEYLNHRISKNSPVILRADIVPHEADWRGGLRYVTETYSEYFEPVIPIAHEIAGTASYSNAIDKICANAEKYHKMSYRINWQASYDFPWFGMYIPPVTDDVEWTTFGHSAGGTRQYAVKKYEEEAAMMKKNGFYTLNYFNVAEMGTYIKIPTPPRTTKNDNDLWKNGNDYVYEKLGDAILMQPVNPDAAKGNQADYEGKPLPSWEGSLVMDCGVPSYRDFLLEQARRHIEKIPNAAGICIDRLDWLRYYNLRGDDGVSWFHNRPSRSFVVAWNELLEPLGKIMHDANKVIYANNLDKRMDVLKNLDGIYDEFGDHGTALNLTAFCTLKCPALGWTRSEKDLQPDPDAYFQKFIYLGVYPTAPLDGNDHTIRPNAIADKYYTDYGPLMDAIRGKQWVLQPHCIEVKGGDAKANLFAVPDGFAVPVCFAKNGKTVEVLIRNVNGLANAKAEAIHPGGATAAVPVRYENETLTLQVPVERGTAMVRITINN